MPRDFNEILIVEEKKDDVSQLIRCMDDFNATLEEVKLHDLSFSSYMCTWDNGR